MTIQTITPELLAGSVLSVPPLARKADYSLDREGNRRILAHLAAGGVTTALYGGNANLYNMGVREFGALLDQLEDIAPADSWIIPSVGPDYGNAEDQLAILKDRALPTAMLLPLVFPATSAGVATGVRRLAERFGRPLIAYVKDSKFITAGDLAGLFKDGAVCAIKYAIVLDDPTRDPYLDALLKDVDRRYIVSGMGERPAVAHLSQSGLNGFTSGSVCIAPAMSQGILLALKAGDVARANALREKFLPLEDLRDGHSPLRVLHAAVAAAGVAETGPLLPFLDTITDADLLARIAAAAKALLAEEM
ncbi:MAG: dihydrodipicolinate synthase family protein, partial [Hyphomicrobiales bacterium]